MGLRKQNLESIRSQEKESGMTSRSQAYAAGAWTLEEERFWPHLGTLKFEGPMCPQEQLSSQ